MGTEAKDHQSLVSVVIPTFERPSYLRLALASAVAQSYRNLEIIVCDNASPTDPSGIVAEFGDPRIHLNRNTSNLGPTVNTLNGVAKAKGKYIAILGDDDIWREDFIASLLAPMEADPEIVVSFCDHDIIDAKGVVNAGVTDRVTRRFGRHLLHDGIYKSFDDIALVYRAICVVSGSIIRKDAIDWSRIPRDMPMSVDLYIDYLLATSGGSCAFRSARLMQYRYHSLQTPGSFTNVHSSWRENLRWTLDVWSTFQRDERLRSRSYLKMICARKAAVILLEQLRHGDWAGIRADAAKFFHSGLLDPRAIYYHIYYFLLFQWQRTGRLVP
jgi:glycosyltransferase involved in cell wall biosynthesis